MNQRVKVPQKKSNFLNLHACNSTPEVSNWMQFAIGKHFPVSYTQWLQVNIREQIADSETSVDIAHTCKLQGAE